MNSTICVKTDTSSNFVEGLNRPQKVQLFLLFSALVVAIHSSESLAEVSHPELALEAAYTEALLYYNRREFDRAGKLLDQALKINPHYIPALEMRALTLKIKGNDDRALEIYNALIQEKPESEQGPYHFELATIYQKSKDKAKLKYHLEKAIQLQFNEVPSHLLLANLEFSDGDYASANEHFRYVRDHAPTELKLVAHYFLGLVNFQMSHGAIATAEMIEAKELAEKLPKAPGAADILKSAEQLLEPFKKPRFFINASTVGQYDSNVAQIPLGISNPVQLSGKSTGRLNTSAGLGWMDAPLRTIQMVFNYQGSYNKNTNANTQNLEFFTHSASIYANYQPLALLSAGLKATGNYIFQNRLTSPTSSSYILGKSSASAEVGPFIKFFLNSTLQTQIDFYYRPQVSYLYPTQNGYALGTKIQFTSNSVNKFFNPNWGLSFERTNTAGTDSRYLAYGAEFANVMRLTGKDTLTQSIDVLYTHYFDSSPNRADINIPLRINWSHYFSPQWMLICDVTYVTNLSTISASYAYNRITSGLGISWTPL